MNFTSPSELFGPGFWRTRSVPLASSSMFSAVSGMTVAESPPPRTISI